MKKYKLTLILTIILAIVLIGFFSSIDSNAQNNFTPGIETSLQLKNPSKEIQAIYVTAPFITSNFNLTNTINLIKESELNAVVIDLKDYSGTVYFDNQYDFSEKKWLNLDYLISKFHQENIYVIARIVVFEDSLLAKENPEIAIKDKEGNLWQDRKGLNWIDPASQKAWKYNVDIAKHAWEKGFDEINFDYIRFPTDGNLNNVSYPFFKKNKKQALLGFFKYAREEMPEAVFSGDLFGLTTVSDNIGIGQEIKNTLVYFNFACPMIYPSHFAKGFNGYENPVDNPYQIVYESLLSAKLRLDSPLNVRPWLQDFNYRSEYGVPEVKKQIQATKDALQEDYIGYILWNSSSLYTREALIK